MSKEDSFSKYRDLLAWRVYKYFTANKKLLKDEEYKSLYERAKNILLNHFSSECEDSDKEIVELAMKLYAIKENKEHPDRFIVIDVIKDISNFIIT